MRGKRIVLLAFFLRVLPTWGYGEMVSLDSGACWLKENTESLKVVSFNEGISGYIFRKYFQQQIGFNVKALLDTGDFAFQISYYCGGGSSRFLVNVQGEQGVCLHYRYLVNELQLIGTYSNPLVQSGPCLGIEPGKLILYGELNHAQLSWLKHDYANTVLKVESFGKLHEVFLTKDFFFKEELVKEQMVENHYLAGVNIIYNEIVLHVGDTHTLLWDKLPEGGQLQSYLISSSIPKEASPQDDSQ